ncbi:unnamed protein product [Vicia faba]|uniref:Uncharacterized protein n=1 Tax=Vicia faba TaxID=3906 RepID=A0AAV1A0T4_VICFA|nr:unnamed protein product [Vicia faba]
MSVATLAYRDILQKQTQNTNQHFQNSQFFHRITASLSPSSVINLQMESISPFSTSQDKYHLMRVQISGHSSVQSSTTFRSRKARKPIYILRFKKIEQGEPVVPQNFPSHISQYISSGVLKLLKKVQGLTRQTPS